MNDPFLVLGLEPRFDIDLDALERRHRELSRVLHPDKYAGAPASERRLSLGKAVEVNEAFRILRDPIRRAEALLARLGVEVREGKEPKPEPQFLMQVMEDREALADARAARDRGKVAKLGRTVRARYEAALGELAAAFAGPSVSAGDPASIDQVISRIGDLRYFRRFLDEVAAIEDELGALPPAGASEQAR